MGLMSQRSTPRILSMALATLTFAAPAMAMEMEMDGPLGVAFAEAPELSSGMCAGPSMDSAMQCARELCVANSDGYGYLAACYPVAWCQPAGWSVAVSLLNVGGPHWREISCGWPGQEAALAAAKILCDHAHRNEALDDCAISGLWDQEGREIPLEDMDE